MHHVGVPTTIDAVPDADWLTDALDDFGDGDRVIAVEDLAPVLV